LQLFGAAKRQEEGNVSVQSASLEVDVHAELTALGAGRVF
jgi:hypothetical protein